MSVRKIAVLQPLKDACAERAANYIVTAARSLGLEAGRFAQSEAMLSYQPDLVLVMSHQEPKLTPYPTYGVLTASWLEYQTPRFLRNILSYDAFFTVSESVRQWLEDLTFGARKHSAPVGFLAPTVPATAFNPRHQRIRKIAHVENGDAASRHFLSLLSKKPYLREYKRPPAKRSRQNLELSEMPARGEPKALDRYRISGAGLYLDQLQNCGDRSPSIEFFEIVASGSVAICTRNPFIERWFGNSVLYIETDAPPKVQIWQVDRHMEWLANNPEAAQEMARRAHDVFSQHLALEQLLPRSFQLHEEIIRDKGYTPTAGQYHEESTPSIACILRTEGAPHRALESLRAQNYPRLQVFVTPLRELPDLPSLAEHYPDLHLQILPFAQVSRCAALWHGLRAVVDSGSDLFGLLEDRDELFPNHFRTLVRTLCYLDNRTWFGSFGLAYAGCVESAATHFSSDRLKDKRSLPGKRRLRIREFHFYHPSRLDFGAHRNHPSSFLARTKLLDDEILTDPELEEGAEDYLQLLLAEKALFAFSCEVTSTAHDSFESPKAQGSVIALKGSQLRTFFRTLGRSFPAAGLYLHNVVFMTHFDPDLSAPILHPEQTGEPTRAIPTSPLKAFGGTKRRGEQLQVPNKMGAGAKLPLLKLMPGRYLSCCYFSPGKGVESDRPLFVTEFSGNIAVDPVEVTASSAGSTGDARIASLDFEISPEACKHPIEIRLKALGNGCFDILGFQLQRINRVVKRSLLDLPPDRPFWIYGAGEGGRATKRKLDLMGIKIAGFIDKHKTGFLENLPIINLEKARKSINENTTVIISSIFWQEIRDEFRQLKIVTNLYSAYPYEADIVYEID